jgi:hypothetical protein
VRDLFGYAKLNILEGGILEEKISLDENFKVLRGISIKKLIV